MKSFNSARLVSTGGILTAFAVLFQSAPVFLPGAGLALSPFSSLPIALAAITSIKTGIIAMFASALILFMISPEEAVIFLVTTGPLGLVLGSSYIKGIIKSVLYSGLTLFTGINILSNIIGIPAFGNITPVAPTLIGILILILFSVLYSGIWLLIMKFFISVLKRTNIFGVFDLHRK